MSKIKQKKNDNDNYEPEPLEQIEVFNSSESEPVTKNALESLSINFYPGTYDILLQIKSKCYHCGNIQTSSKRNQELIKTISESCPNCKEKIEITIPYLLG